MSSLPLCCFAVNAVMSWFKLSISSSHLTGTLSNATSAKLPQLQELLYWAIKKYTKHQTEEKPTKQPTTNTSNVPQMCKSTIPVCTPQSCLGRAPGAGAAPGMESSPLFPGWEVRTAQGVLHKGSAHPMPEGRARVETGEKQEPERTLEGYFGLKGMKVINKTLLYFCKTRLHQAEWSKGLEKTQSKVLTSFKQHGRYSECSTLRACFCSFTLQKCLWHEVLYKKCAYTNTWQLYVKFFTILNV